MLSQPESTRDKSKGVVRDRKKLISQTDLRNLRPYDDKMPVAPPKFTSYGNSLTQKNISTKKINFATTSPKNFYPQYRQETRHAYTKSDTLKTNNSKLEIKNGKEHITTEGLLKIDQAYGIVAPQVSTKNRSVPSRKSLRTEISTFETKNDTVDKGASPKQEQKYKVVKQNDVVKQIEAQIQLHRRIKKPVHTTKSLALSTNNRDSSVINDSKVSDRTSQRRSISIKDVPFAKLELPVKPEVVLERFSSQLASHEREEIINYPEIYYIADLDHKLPAKSEQECDDERGDYIVIRNDHVQYRYEILEMLGRGSFGQVVKAFDHKKQEYVAIKIIRSPKKFHLQAKIEVKILKYMMQHRGADFNITELKSFFVFRQHVCLVFDLMSLNLYDFLKKNKFKGFSLSVIRKFAIQILYALKFLNHHKIIHCDLKPENILLKQINKTGVKLIDFGSSCFENEKLYTYIQSRFYRSPEIILGLSYTTQIDMWSFGCLLCELYLGYPIFAGDSEHDQLLAMIEVLGVPDKKLIMPSPKKEKFFDEDCNPKIVPNTKGRIRKPNSVPMDSVFDCDDESFLDLVRNCLKYDPTERFTPTAALGHDWILKGLPPELKSQHMKLLQKANEAISVDSGLLIPKDQGNNLNGKSVPEYVSIKQDYQPEESSQRGKHKKTTSESLQRVALFKVEEKTVPSFLSKKKSIMSITNNGEDDSMGNLTINLNESKQSIGAAKIYSRPSFISPHSSTTKDKSKIINNFFYVTNSKNPANNAKAQDTITTPKKTQTVRDASEEDIINGLRTSYLGDSKAHNTSFKTVQKSLSLEKKLYSPKISDSIIKAFQSEEKGNLSAPRNIGFPILRSPIRKK